MWRSDPIPSFLPIPWFYKFSVWDRQFQYYLWVPNSGLISNTVKSAKNSMFKVLGIAVRKYASICSSLLVCARRSICAVSAVYNRSRLRARQEEGRGARLKFYQGDRLCHIYKKPSQMLTCTAMGDNSIN